METARETRARFDGAPPAELRELQIFLTVAEELHFGHAAERLQMNRSRVSQVINTLEVRIGARLFDRTSRSVRLTPIGQELIAETAGPYRELLRAFEHIREAATGVAGTLRVGSYSTISLGPHWLQIVSTFETRYPACKVMFADTGVNRDYLEPLRAGELDIVASRLPLQQPDLTIGPILSHEPRVLVLSQHDPLATRASVSIEDLADRTVAQSPNFPQEMMDAFIPPVTPSGTPLRRVTTGSIEEVRLRLGRGEQVHPTVPSWLDHHPIPGIMSIPISDLPPSQTALVWLTQTHSPKIEAFVRAAADLLAHTELAAHQPRYTRAELDDVNGALANTRSLGYAEEGKRRR